MVVGVAFYLKLAWCWSILIRVTSREYIEQSVCICEIEETKNGKACGGIIPVNSTGSWTYLPMTSRVVVVGDIHGGLEALTDCLVTANLIDEHWNWIGGHATLVSIGDVFDRGIDDLETTEALLRLKKVAQTQNGTVLLMLGNHEVLNARGDHRYAHPGTYKYFNKRFRTEDNVEQWINKYRDAMKPNKLPDVSHARIAAMIQGGSVAKMLSNHSTIAIVGDTLFVHGGMKLKHLDDLECGRSGLVVCLTRLNDDMANWLNGDSAVQFEGHIVDPMPWEKALWGSEGMLWTRTYSNPPGEDLLPSVVKELEAVLERMGVSRMVVGHTPQPNHGINSAAGGKVWRIDTGMTPMIGGPREVLEILPDGNVFIISTMKGRIPGPERDTGRFGTPVTV